MQNRSILFNGSGRQPNGTTAASSSSSSPPGINFGLPLLICFLVVGVVAVCLFVFAKASFRRRQRLLMLQQQQQQQVELSRHERHVEMVNLADSERRRIIESKLVTTTFQPDNNNDNNNNQSPDALSSCSICLNEFQKGENISGSSNPECRHWYHTDCIVSVFLSSRPTADCPVCRRNFIPNEDGGMCS